MNIRKAGKIAARAVATAAGTAAGLLACVAVGVCLEDLEEHWGGGMGIFPDASVMAALDDAGLDWTDNGEDCTVRLPAADGAGIRTVRVDWDVRRVGWRHERTLESGEVMRHVDARLPPERLVAKIRELAGLGVPSPGGGGGI